MYEEDDFTNLFNFTITHVLNVFSVHLNGMSVALYESTIEVLKSFVEIKKNWLTKHKVGVIFSMCNNVT